jgi:hypothetical protein
MFYSSHAYSSFNEEEVSNKSLKEMKILAEVNKHDMNAVERN